MNFAVIDLPWWGYVLVMLVFTHITIAAVTIYLHRCQAHRALDLHPVISHFFRFWLWLTTGMVTKQWAAIHRKHHARCETVEDPHSPQVLGITKVLREGAELYRAETENQETLDKYGKGTPDDWLEQHVYSRHTSLGIYSMLVINLVLFGPIKGIGTWQALLSRLLELGFLIQDMLTYDGIELLDLHFFGHGALVLGRGVEMTGAGAGFQFDFFTHDAIP